MLVWTACRRAAPDRRRPAAPGIAMRAWTKRSRRSAGLPASRPMAGSSRRSPPNRSSSRCGRSAMPLRSRSSVDAPSQWLPRPSTAHWLARLSPVVSTGWMLPVKRLPAKTLASELSLTRMPTWLPAIAVAEDAVAVAVLEEDAERVAGDLVGRDQRVVDRLQQQAVGAVAAVGDEAVAARSGPSSTSAPRRRRCPRRRCLRTGSRPSTCSGGRSGRAAMSLSRTSLRSTNEK